MKKETLIVFVLFILLLFVLNLVVKSLKKESFDTTKQASKIDLDNLDKLPYCFEKYNNKFFTQYNSGRDLTKCNVITKDGEFSQEKYAGLFYDLDGGGGISNCIISCANCEDCKSVYVSNDEETGNKKCTFVKKSGPLRNEDGKTIYEMKKCDNTCKDKGEENDLPLCHKSKNCDSFPFNNYIECSPDLDPDIPDIHIQRQNNQKIYKDIHYVNPFNPCCLRTCINDFTYATDQEASSASKKFGEYKDNIPVDMLFASKCAQCLSRFEPSLKMIKEPDTCENEGE